MRMTARRRRSLWIAPLLIGSFTFATTAQAGQVAARPHLRFVDGHRVGLGKVLSSSDGGQIFGWDINANGTDGVLATSQNEGEGYKVSVQTFDQTRAKVTHTFARQSGTRDSYGVDGIFAGDVALVTHYVVPHGTIYAKRFYDLMDPVTAQRFTDPWTSPVKNFDVIQGADNQSTNTTVLYGIQLNQHSDPALVVSDLTTAPAHSFRSTGRRTRSEARWSRSTPRGTARCSRPRTGRWGDPPIMALVNLTTGHVF